MIPTNLLTQYATIFHSREPGKFFWFVSQNNRRLARHCPPGAKPLTLKKWIAQQIQRLTSDPSWTGYRFVVIYSGFKIAHDSPWKIVESSSDDSVTAFIESEGTRDTGTDGEEEDTDTPMGSAQSNGPVDKDQKYAAIYWKPPHIEDVPDEGWACVLRMDQRSLDCLNTTTASRSGTPCLEDWVEGSIDKLKTNQDWKDYQFDVRYSDRPISQDDPYNPQKKK